MNRRGFFAAIAAVVAAPAVATPAELVSAPPPVSLLPIRCDAEWGVAFEWIETLEECPSIEIREYPAVAFKAGDVMTIGGEV